MKAIVYHNYGSPGVLRLEEIPKPIPNDDEVLVKIHAVSLNAADLDFLKGTAMARPMGFFKPKYNVLGSDIAGRVEAVGGNVKRFQPDDEVFGDTFDHGFGAFAEFACVPEKAMALKPEFLTFGQAVTLPQSGVMALQGLRDHRKVQPGDKVLINGAGGGVGTFAIQIAKEFAAEVTGVDSGDKFDLMRTIGADHVIDYTQEDYTRTGKRYDLILDMVARRSIFDYKRALNQGGNFVVVGGSVAAFLQTLFPGSLISMTGSRKMSILMWKSNREEDLATLYDLIESGKVAPIIDKRYPLSETAEALRYLDDGHALGKIVITME